MLEATTRNIVAHPQGVFNWSCLSAALPLVDSCLVRLAKYFDAFLSAGLSPGEGNENCSAVMLAGSRNVAAYSSSVGS